MFRVAEMDPEHTLIRYGRADQAFVISPQVFEPDEHGRSYRFRPNVRSIWLRQITLRDGPFALFQVLDTPAHCAAAARAGAIVEETSAQHTNSWGLRGPEPDLSAPVRGIVLGDSFMQGMFVGDKDTPPLCLERYLESVLKVPVTVVNTGHIGYSPEQYYYSLREYGERVQPQFVVVSVCPNDFGDGLAVLRGEGDGFDEAEHWLGEIRDWCYAHNAARLLVVIPTRLQIERMRLDAFYPGRVCNIAHTASEGYCDPLNEFVDECMSSRQATRRAGRPALPCDLYNHQIHDDHFSPRGAALWAQIVGRRLTLLSEFDRPANDPATHGLSCRARRPDRSGRKRRAGIHAGPLREYTGPLHAIRLTGFEAGARMVTREDGEVRTPRGSRMLQHGVGCSSDRAGENRGAVALLSEPVRAWFESAFPEGPTPGQALAWPAIAAGEHVLLIAPTGTGKTLAAFLAILDRLVRARQAGTLGPGPALRVRLAAAEPQLRHRAQPGRAAGGDRSPARAGRRSDPRRRADGGHLGLRAPQAPRRPAAHPDHHAREPLAAPEPVGMAAALAHRRAPDRRRGPRPGADQARGGPGRLARAAGGAGRLAIPAASGSRPPAGRTRRSRGSWSDRRGAAASSRRLRPPARRRPSSPSRA